MTFHDSLEKLLRIFIYNASTEIFSSQTGKQESFEWVPVEPVRFLLLINFERAREDLRQNPCVVHSFGKKGSVRMNTEA